MARHRLDPFSQAERSRVMSRVRSTGNRSTEVKLMLLFREHRITGWRRKSQLFGRPDFIFPKARVALFVDGCFWHGCKRCYRRPATSQTYWDAKVQRNVARDRLVKKTLKASGWQVLRVWEHEFKRSRTLLRKIRIKLPPP